MEIYGLFELARTAVLVLVVVLAALFLWRAFKGGKHSVLFHILAALTLVICLVVPVVLNGVLGVFGSILNSVMVGGETPEAGDTLDRCRELAFRIAEEGMVLLENKDDALPLEKGEKVNLIGYTSYNPVYSGTGSGFVANDDSIDIVHSLESAGFVLNPELVKSELFAHIASAGEGQSMGFIEPDFSNHEAAASAYTGAVAFDQLAAYSDTAIITFGRRGSENADLAPEYQDLSDNEKSVLEAARANFSKVIVLVNSGNAMDMQWVRDYDVDAVIWTGLPGPYGFEALGRILSGEVNPSGSLPDTWVYDRTSNPVSENFGEQEAANAAGRYYVDYVEGIYVGYKWYETAFAEGAVITNTKNGKTFDFTDYENIVAYPFGYGLSYTSFEEKIVGGSLKDTLSPDGSYTVEVAVTNTGVVAGKRAVQLYVTVPYTDYDREHKVEKAAVSLVTYAKTGLLKPGETETVTLSFELESIASYDSSADNGDGTKGAYMLDAGEYVFSVRSDAHTVLDSVTTSLAETHFYSGDAKRKSDESAVKNQFEDAARGEYLSRDNAFANYASAMASVKNTIEDLTMVENNNVYDKALDEGIAPMVKGKDYAASGTLTLQDLKGASYDDPRWSALISQMTVEELADFAKETMYNTNAIDSIGKPFTVDADGPLGLSSMFKSNLVSVAFPCIPLLAGSFNTELAYGMGADVAELAALNGITGWYAPAMDTHRFALSGRNFEYYSEDATLGALTAVAEVGGARENGLVTFIKHFALNDMETHREFVHTYSNEQAIREIYLKPFEYAVKRGGANGVMTSMNYIGDTYAGAHLNLITNVLRGEWGFLGGVLTDMDQAGEVRSFETSLRAGVDFWLGYSGYNPVVDSDADIYYLQRAAHNHLYQLASANVQEAVLMPWKQDVNMITGALYALAAVCGVSMIVRIVRGMKKRKEQKTA